MGRKQSLICPICNYKTFTSGGPDRGFMVGTNTFVCLDCQALNDLVVHDNRMIEGELSIDVYEKWKQQSEQRRSLSMIFDYDDNNESAKPIYPSFEEWKEQQYAYRASLTSKKCNKCGSHNLELWDNKKRPCPKCETKLQADPKGWTMNWD